MVPAVSPPPMTATRSARINSRAAARAKLGDGEHPRLTAGWTARPGRDRDHQGVGVHGALPGAQLPAGAVVVWGNPISDTSPVRTAIPVFCATHCRYRLHRLWVGAGRPRRSTRRTDRCRPGRTASCAAIRSSSSALRRATRADWYGNPMSFSSGAQPVLSVVQPPAAASWPPPRSARWPPHRAPARPSRAARGLGRHPRWFLPPRRRSRRGSWS
jgi:hypothetical protein